MHKNTSKGVSPVIGVILMVAITVIIAAVVANFVLDLGGTLGQDADASVSFDQEANFGGEDYAVDITVNSMDNSDYLRATVIDGGGDAELNYRTGVEDDVEDDDSVPNDTDNDDLTGDGAVVGISSGDVTTIESLEGVETIQLYGSLDGDENLINEYGVEDNQGFAD